MTGIGFFSAVLVLPEIGDITRFRSARALCSWAGLVPSAHSSGAKIRTGHLTKEGSKYVRWVMIQAVQRAALTPGPLQNYYLRVFSHKGKPIAKIALARKLPKAVYHMLQKHEAFPPEMVGRNSCHRIG